MPLIVSQREAEVMFSLLEAAEDLGLIKNPALLAKWHETQKRFSNEHYQAQAPDLYALLKALEQSGALAGSWIEDHWRKLFILERSASPFPQDPTR